MSIRSGQTPLIHRPDIGKPFGFPNLYVKDESKNPFGTFKDRRSQFIVEHALRNGVQSLCLITMGNAGFSLAQFSRPASIDVVALVDENLTPSILAKLEAESSYVVKLKLNGHVYSPQERVAAARPYANGLLWDVSNGFSEAYGSIIYELQDFKPDYLFCPVGSGESFIGLYDAVNRLGLPTRLVGVSPIESNSIADKLPDWASTNEVEIGRIERAGHLLVRLNEYEILEAYRRFKDVITCEPSSSVVFAALPKVTIPPQANVLLLNSGQGLF